MLLSPRNALQFVRITHLLEKRVPRFSQLPSSMLLLNCTGLEVQQITLKFLKYLRTAEICQVSSLEPHLKLIKITRKISLLSLSFSLGLNDSSGSSGQEKHLNPALIRLGH